MLGKMFFDVLDSSFSFCSCILNQTVTFIFHRCDLEVDHQAYFLAVSSAAILPSNSPTNPLYWRLMIKRSGPFDWACWLEEEDGNKLKSGEDREEKFIFTCLPIYLSVRARSKSKSNEENERKA